MADTGQADDPGGATAGTIRRVPGNLMGFLTSRIAEYVDRTEGITAEIHKYPGQPTKLVLYGAKGRFVSDLFGNHIVGFPTRRLISDLLEPAQQPEDIVKNVKDVSLTNKILVKNFLPVVDEDMLEIFFESKKKSGGGPVRIVQLNREKSWAVVEFCEADAVEGVMSRVPIRMMSQELDIRPYTPLIQGEGQLENLEVRNLPKELTDDLITMHIEGELEENEVSSAEYKSDDGEAEDIEDETRSLEHLGNTDRWKKTKGYVKETITCLHPVQLRMLQRINFPETVLEQLPEVTVEINVENSEISFEGDAKAVLSGYRNLLETMDKFCLYKICYKTEEQIEIYKREKVIEYICNKLETQNVTCTWEVMGRMVVFCTVNESIDSCFEIIDESVTEKKLPVSKESSATLITQEWEKEVKQIEAGNDVVVKVYADKTSTVITVVATNRDADGIVSRINTFLKSQLTIGSEQCSTPDAFQSLYRLNSSLATKLMSLMAEGLSMYYVTLTPKPATNVYGEVNCNFTIVSGTREGRELAKSELQRSKFDKYTFERLGND